MNMDEKKAREQFFASLPPILAADSPQHKEMLWQLEQIRRQTAPTQTWDIDTIELGGDAIIQARIGYADLEKVALIPLEDWAHIKAILEGRTPPPDSMNDNLTTQAREIAKAMWEGSDAVL
jgi:hypothetical protein